MAKQQHNLTRQAHPSINHFAVNFISTATALEIMSFDCNAADAIKTNLLSLFFLRETST